MSTMLCAQFEQSLADQPDSPLSLDAAGHLDACPRCRLLTEDLDAIRSAGQEWGLEEPAPPPHLWTSLRIRLEAENLIAEPVAAAAATTTGWFSGWRIPTPQWGLSGAYLALALLASGLARYPISSYSNAPGAAMQLASPSLTNLGQTLDGNLRRVVASFPATEEDDSVMMSLRHNMGIVDNLIVVCEKSVREHPGDPLAREYLYGAYQQKADLLAVAIDRRTLEIQ